MRAGIDGQRTEILAPIPALNFLDRKGLKGDVGHWLRGLWLRSWKNSPVFAPSLGNSSNSDDPHGSDDHLRTIDHHSFDPLGGCEMD